MESSNRPSRRQLVVLAKLDHPVIKIFKRNFNGELVPVIRSFRDSTLPTASWYKLPSDEELLRDKKLLSNLTDW